MRPIVRGSTYRTFRRAIFKIVFKLLLDVKYHWCDFENVASLREKFLLPLIKALRRKRREEEGEMNFGIIRFPPSLTRERYLKRRKVFASKELKS